MTKQIILGTAGHIDHGKTTLIKALTGVNTDRLAEEQRRGITIELGFASFELPGGLHMGIVDVPGHEKFVKNMVAGASGIDIVAMVIAADEGVMPQTREHLEICTLLGVQHGMVVLTKTDLVDEEWLELVKEDIGDFVRGTFLEDQPVVAVSSVAGDGMKDFIDTLEQLGKSVSSRPESGIFRLPVDRVFTMKGFGTVITGTLISGQVSVGETIMLYPSKITSKVRGIQVHNDSVELASAGMRTAVNFQGLDKTSVMRGDVLSSPEMLQPSYMLDVSFHYLKSNKKPIKNRTRVRFHSGTSEILGILVLLESDELLPGNDAPAQIRLDAPVTLIKDDRFVVRSYSPVQTIGGGTILNPIPPKHKRFKTETIELLQSLSSLPSEEALIRHIQAAGPSGLTYAHLKLMTNLSEKLLEKAMQPLLAKKTAVQIDKEKRFVIHRDAYESLQGNILAHIAEYHRSNPLKSGMPKEELKSRFPSFLDAKLFNSLFQHLAKTEAIVQEEETVRLTSHKILLAGDQADIRKKLLNHYAEHGLMPPSFKEFCKEAGIEEKQAEDVLIMLVEEGLIIKIKSDLYFSAEAVNSLKTKMTAFLKSNGEMTTPEFKGIAGVSRKYLIPLIEYFDSQNVTLRVGDVRMLRKQQKTD